MKRILGLIGVLVTALAAQAGDLNNVVDVERAVIGSYNGGYSELIQDSFQDKQAIFQLMESVAPVSGPAFGVVDNPVSAGAPAASPVVVTGSADMLALFGGRFTENQIRMRLLNNVVVLERLLYLTTISQNYSQIVGLSLFDKQNLQNGALLEGDVYSFWRALVDMAGYSQEALVDIIKNSTDVPPARVMLAPSVPAVAVPVIAPVVIPVEPVVIPVAPAVTIPVAPTSAAGPNVQAILAKLTREDGSLMLDGQQLADLLARPEDDLSNLVTMIGQGKSPMAVKMSLTSLLATPVSAVSVAPAKQPGKSVPAPVVTVTPVVSGPAATSSVTPPGRPSIADMLSGARSLRPTTNAPLAGAGAPSSAPKASTRVEPAKRTMSLMDELRTRGTGGLRPTAGRTLPPKEEPKATGIAGLLGHVKAVTGSEDSDDDGSDWDSDDEDKPAKTAVPVISAVSVAPAAPASTGRGVPAIPTGGSLTPPAPVAAPRLPAPPKAPNSTAAVTPSRPSAVTRPTTPPSAGPSALLTARPAAGVDEDLLEGAVNAVSSSPVEKQITIREARIALNKVENKEAQLRLIENEVLDDAFSKTIVTYLINSGAAKREDFVARGKGAQFDAWKTKLGL